MRLYPIIFERPVDFNPLININPPSKNFNHFHNLLSQTSSFTPLLSSMEWTRGPIIGRGSTAAVSLASTADSSGRIFAVKSAELSRSLPLQREQSLLSKLSSSQIVSCLGFDITRENSSFLYNLWMEYLPGGSLRELIQRHGGFLDESTARSFAVQVMEGLRYLHWNGIAHCDLKSQNILIGEDGPKIADLGCAKLIRRNPRSCSMADFSGTPMFMAPEVARGEEQGFEADIWAFGCLVIEMVTGANPWSSRADPVSILYRIGFSDDVPEIPAWLSDDARDFLGRCLTRDPRQRWTAEQLLGHPFLNGSGRWAKVACPDVGSPIGVLDQAFWDSAEGTASEVDLEASPNAETSTELDSCCSAGERIEHLIQNIGSVIQVMPDWTDDVGWLAVRSNDHETPEHIPSLNGAAMGERPPTSTHQSELELATVANNNMYQPIFVENSGVATNSNTNRVFSYDCNEVVDGDDHGLMDLDFERPIMSTLMLSTQYNLINKHRIFYIIIIIYFQNYSLQSFLFFARIDFHGKSHFYSFVHSFNTINYRYNMHSFTHRGMKKAITVHMEKSEDVPMKWFHIMCC